MLVMARVLGPGWAGAHVRVQVDNAAVKHAFHKGRGKNQDETDMVREVLLIQAKQGWSWEVEWVPRELNDPADALSKNDIERFRQGTGGKWMLQRHVTAEDLALPVVGAAEQAHRNKRLGRGKEQKAQTGVRQGLTGGVWGPEQKPHRRILEARANPKTRLQGKDLWDHLGSQVKHVEGQLKTPATTVQIRACDARDNIIIFVAVHHNLEAR